MQLRTVSLNEGPFNGQQTKVSHGTAVVRDGDRVEVYVWNGSEDGCRFLHAITMLNRLPDEKRRADRKTWLEIERQLSNSHPVEAARLIQEFSVTNAPYLVNAWTALTQNGLVEQVKE